MKKTAEMQSTDLCVLRILMKQMHVPKSKDTINEYCYEHFQGDFECTLAEGKGRRHCRFESLSEVSWTMEQQSQANCQKERSRSFLESSRIMIAKKAVPQGELLFQEHGNAQKMSQYFTTGRKFAIFWWCMRDMSDMSIISTYITHELFFVGSVSDSMISPDA